MSRHVVIALCLLTCIVAPTEGRTLQEADDALRLAVEALGAEDLEILRYSGSGSSYSFGLDAVGQETREHSTVVAYAQEINHSSSSSHLQVTRLTREPRSEETENRIIDLEAPWESQVELWLNPHLFLQQALSADAHVDVEREQGEEYTVVSFETPDGHLLSGYIDDQNMLKRIRTRFDHPVLGERLVEGTFLDYENFGGVQFPTMLVHKQNGSPTLILVVKEVEHEGSSV